MHYLITGGAGFIGSHLAEALINSGHYIDCLDNFNDYYDPKTKTNNVQIASTSKRYKLIKGDILDFDFLCDIFKKNHYDAIVHLAARAGVRPSIQNPILYEEVNVKGTMLLLELCKKHQIKKFIFASSSSVYGANKKVPFSEQDSVDNPISPYAATKKAGELVCYTYHKLFNIAISCLRFFTVYGPRQRPDMAIHKFAKLISSGKSIPVFGSGKSKRDYTYIDDIIEGILGSIKYCNAYHIYNLGESKTVELLYLIKLLEKALGKTAKIEFLPEQQGDVPITYSNIAQAKKELSYVPQTSIEVGIQKFVRWYESTLYI